MHIKGISSPNSKQINRTKHALAKAYETIYKGVAFDIDGTLTKADSFVLHEDAIQAIVHLLHRGVPVLLITGRGRSSARSAVQQIINVSKIDSWHLSLLSVITHNGTLWLRNKIITNSSGCISKILGDEIWLAPSFNKCIRIFLYALYSNEQIAKAIANGTISITEEPNTDPRGLRVVLNRKENIPFTDHIKDILFEAAKKCEDIFITKGIYGTKVSFDVYNTNKVIAIKKYCDAMGFKLEELLRIGDQGGEDGNDYEFLDSSRAFSVRNVNNHPERCFPVLDDEGKSQLKGINATRILLQRVKILPPLTLYPADTPEDSKFSQFEESFFPELLLFERKALERSRQEKYLLSQNINLRIKRLVDSSEYDSKHIALEDIFEPLNGGIRIWDWEIIEIEDVHPILDIFNINRKFLSQPHKIQYTWSMPTDENILLRGPHYYWAMANSDLLHAPNYLKIYGDLSLRFIDDSVRVMRSLSNEPASFVKFKFLLGVIDNIRNILLQWIYITYKIEMASNQGYSNTQSMFSGCLLPHTQMFVDALFNPDLYWQPLVRSYYNLLQNIKEVFESNYRACLNAFNTEEHHKPLIRKWREADNFFENVLAIEIGLHELGGRFLHEEPRILVGLAYGGIELPIIAKVLGEKKGIQVVPAFMELSLYGNKDVRYRVLKGELTEDYFEQFEDSFPKSYVFLSRDGGLPQQYKAIILDDNCTTCRTLGLARDWLENQGHKVEGAIVVRYPGSNRYLQMKLPNHGAPNPKIFLTFIKGLVAPSPYTRLTKDVFSDMENPSKFDTVYLDKTNIFDLSKEKVKRFLFKGENRS